MLTECILNKGNMHKKYESILDNATSCYFGVYPL